MRFSDDLPHDDFHNSSRAPPINMPNTATLDRFAIGFSLICAVHCLLLPAMVTLLPALSGTLFGDEQFHKWLLLIVIPASLVSLSIGCRKHGRWRTMSLGGVGLVILVAAAFFGHDWMGELGEKVTTVLGAALVALSHVSNLKACKQYCACL
jgi:hypothetical protein